MSVLFMDGFDAGDYTLGKYSSYHVAGLVATTRFSSGQALSLVSNALRHIQRHFTAANEVFIGFAMYITDGNVGTSVLTFFGDNGTTKHMSLRRVNGAQWGISRGDTTVAVFPAPSAQRWIYVEMSSTVADTGGTCVVRIDGQTVVSYTGDTRNGGTNTTMDMMRIGTEAANYIACYPYIDDLYICDSNGATNNAFLGDVRIQTLVPSAAGSSTQLTATGGANYANVADIPDSIATYNASSTVGNKDLYALGNLTAGTATVKCVQVNTHSWKDDAGAASLKVKIKSGATEVAGVTTSLPSSVAWVGDRWETDPDTSAAWTVSAVNSLEAGAEVA